MGRVRRYKKLKSCDPFAKRRKSEVDEKYDQPPSDIEDDFEGDGQDDDLLFVSRSEDERRGGAGGAVPFKGGGMPAAAAAKYMAIKRASDAKREGLPFMQQYILSAITAQP